MLRITAVILALTVNIFAAATTNDCFSGSLTDFQCISDYAPAEAYCAQLYPRAFAARAVCSPEPTSATEKRSANPIERRDDYRSSDWAYVQQYSFQNLTQQDQPTIEQVCYCIAAFSSRSITTTITCEPSEYCDAQTGICKTSNTQRNCDNPARCDASSICLNENAQTCFCHPDTDDSTSGYCLGDGPAGAPCPDVYEDCASNSECGDSRVCIYACCREEPFCVALEDYSCDNYQAPARLLRRSSVRTEGAGMNPKALGHA